MATKAEVTALKRRHGRALLQLDGVEGVGVGRKRDDDEDENGYALVVYLSDNRPATRQRVRETVGRGQPLRLLRSGPFGPQ